MNHDQARRTPCRAGARALHGALRLGRNGTIFLSDGRVTYMECAQTPNVEPFLEVPNLVTHVHGACIQTAGLPPLADTASIAAGAPEEVAFTRAGVLVGAVAMIAPR
ncbi:hypothetical protein [Nonomuraea sp. CA-141351]|uniref:hypothetical protein n=1 Tax=Nonomuraea sp. CA-141351 TaxID=3239996 RepID=UPI003D9369DB